MTNVCEDRSCPICGRREKKLLYRQEFSHLSDQIQLGGYDVTICENCGGGFADQIPNQDWFNAYYKAMSKYTNDQRGGDVSTFDTERFRDISKLISEFVPAKSARILDFGCASGGLLKELQTLGYNNLLGAERSASAAELARRKYRIRVVNSPLTDIAREEEPFDLLIQVGVLEHLCDVDGILNEMRTVLKPGGLMYIEVPDAIGFNEHAGAPFQHFSVEHINFFSSVSLTNLMLPNQFEPLQVERTARNQTANAKMPVVCGFFRMQDSSPTGFERDDQTEVSLRTYIEQSNRMEATVARVIDSLVVARTPILVWGVGTHTLHLLKTTRFAELDVVAFIDSNTSYQNRQLNGKPVLTPEALAHYAQPILISSQMFQSEIEHQIQRKLRLENPLIKLY